MKFNSLDEPVNLAENGQRANDHERWKHEERFQYQRPNPRLRRGLVPAAWRGANRSYGRCFFGISPEQFARLYEKNRHAYDRGELTPERYWYSFADEPGISLREDKIPLLRAWDVEMWSNTTPVMLDHFHFLCREL